MKERNKAVGAAYLFLRKRDEILLMRRQGSGYYDGWCSVPAGHIEPGELPKEALVREVKEELDIGVLPDDLRLVHTLYQTKHDETGDRLDLFFETDKYHGTPKINEPHKCDDVRWFEIDSLPRDRMMHHVLGALALSLQDVPYSELSKDQIVPNPSLK